MQNGVRRCNVKLLFIFLVFSCCILSAQTSEKTSLVTLFTLLEEKFDVRFSYASEAMSQMEVSNPPTNTLDDALLFLSNNTPLQFNRINDRYISVIFKNDAVFLCGKIIDAVTLAPLQEATVRTNDDGFSTVTTAEGSFQLKADKTIQNAIISYVGYETLRIATSELNSDCPVFKMYPTISQLEQVLLRTYFTKGISKHLNGSFIIDTDNFGLLPGQVEGDVLQIAQGLPGVESVDETISNINIRGGTHDENNILWDDIKMYQSGHFFGLISAFNPDLTKKVTVIKNGTHPRFGEGVSGVIDMRSHNDIADKLSGGAGFNLINTHAFAEIPVTDKFGVQVSGRRSINDFLESPIYGIYEDKVFQDTEITRIESDETGQIVSSDNTFTFYDFSTKFLWDVNENTKLRLNFLTVDNALEFTETVDGSQNSETSDLQQRSIVGGIYWEQQWNEKIKTNFLGYGSYYLLNSINEEIFTTQELEQENEVLDLGLKLDVSYEASEKLRIEGGYHFSEVGIANTQDINLPRFRSYEKNVLRTHIVYAFADYSPNQNNTHFYGGLRANYFDKFNKTLVEPRLSIHQKLGGGFSLQLLGEFKSQITTQRIDFESDFLGVEKRRWVLADEVDVPIIQSKQASIGITFNKNNWFINLEGFYKQVEGITTSNQGFQNQFQFARSSGNYDAKGFEFVLNKKSKHFSTWISYMFINNDYHFEGLTPSNFPSNLDIHHSATIASVYTLNNLKFAMGVNWHTGKPYTSPLRGNEINEQNGFFSINYDRPNEERLPNYFRTNLSAEYLWELSQRLDAKFNFALVNVFGTKNTLNTRYAIDTDENGEARVNQIDEVSLGFTPNFSVQFLF
ncbi:TonB-dependent receptor [Ulvibacter antarcticus]|uniref:TonB-dependent receptor-like protein n=1 Tax=Ulvibacter antarcticus TaxID=442714 RepID=A0A3L9YG26_9FLAO|nr:TonB-dependent receptor [Ulvibacter antarcticus]RMA57055.1 TonB-dependent receptor-like protein [Ulvibacter antarcticus]